jgi:hypothetical protein
MSGVVGHSDTWWSLVDDLGHIRRPDTSVVSVKWSGSPKREPLEDVSVFSMPTSLVHVRLEPEGVDPDSGLEQPSIRRS